MNSCCESSSGLPNYDDALIRVLEESPCLHVEQVSLAASRGRILREDVHADRDQPPFNRAAMDGFAVRGLEIVGGREYEVTGVLAAGGNPASISPDQTGVIRIATGAALPSTFDAVIPIELCQLRSDGATERVSFDADQLKPWCNIHRQGSDAHAGDCVIQSGTCLSAAHLAVAAAMGQVELNVAAQPRITLLTTGDEVRDPRTATDALEPHHIRNTNAPMLRALCESWGSPILEHVHVGDEAQQVLAAAREAISRSHLVITVGGVSAGDRDFLPWAWKQLGLRKVLRGVNIQPGKPVFVATPSEKDCPDNKLVIGLPGNPVSVFCTAHLFVRPLLQWMAMRNFDEQKPREEIAAWAKRYWHQMTLAQDIRRNPGRDLFRAVQFDCAGQIRLIPWQGSGDLIHLAHAQSIVRISRGEQPIMAGTQVPSLIL